MATKLDYKFPHSVNSARKNMWNSSRKEAATVVRFKSKLQFVDKL
jgi:hypothetical protein